MATKRETVEARTTARVTMLQAVLHYETDERGRRRERVVGVGPAELPRVQAATWACLGYAVMAEGEALTAEEIREGAAQALAALAAQRTAEGADPATFYERPAILRALQRIDALTAGTGHEGSAA